MDFQNPFLHAYPPPPHMQNEASCFGESGAYSTEGGRREMHYRTGGSHSQYLQMKMNKNKSKPLITEQIHHPLYDHKPKDLPCYLFLCKGQRLNCYQDLCNFNTCVRLPLR